MNRREWRGQRIQMFAMYYIVISVTNVERARTLLVGAARDD